jgi:hypothetical protein
MVSENALESSQSGALSMSHYCSESYREIALKRVAELIRDAHLIFFEQLNHRRLVDAKLEEDFLILFEEDHDRVYDWFADFGNHLFTDKVDRCAALTFLKCQEGLAYFHEIAMRALGASTSQASDCSQSETTIIRKLNVEVQEVKLLLKAVTRKVGVRYDDGEQDDNWPDCTHFVLRCNSLDDKKQWVLDFTGAQYGIMKACWNWEEYSQKFEAHVLLICKPGTNRDYITECSRLPGTHSLQFNVRLKAVGSIVEAITAWENNHVSLHNLLTLDDGECEEQKKGLLQTIAETVKNFKKANMSKYSLELHRLSTEEEECYSGDDIFNLYKGLSKRHFPQGSTMN